MEERRKKWRRTKKKGYTAFKVFGQDQQTTTAMNESALFHS